MIVSATFADDAPPSKGPEADVKYLDSLDLESLLNIKVTTASKFSEKLSDAPGVMSVVTNDELKRFGGLTLREILERVAGLAGSTASFTDRSMVAARGDQTKINGGHILFLINGRPTREILEGGLIGDLLESFPVNILERIEVIKGPGSVLYGSNAFSAVVNLITQKADEDRLVITGLGGQGPGVDTSGQFTVKHGDFSMVGAGQFHQKPDWFTPVWTSFFGLENPTIPDRGKSAYLSMNYKGFSAMSTYTEWKTSYIEGMVGKARWRRGFGDLGYSWKASPNWDMALNLTFTRATLNAQSAIPFITRESNEALLEWTNVARLGSKDRLTFGALYNYIHGAEEFYGSIPSMLIANGSRPGEAFYAQVDHELRQNLKLIGGFQANKIGHIKLDVVPRAGVIWNPASRVTVKALYSEAFRAPSLNETLLNYVPPPEIGGPSLKGTPNLLPEKVATADIGLGYHGSRFQAGLDYFHSKQTDNIILADATWGGKYINLGKAIFQGAEFEGKYYFGTNLFLMGSALYQANHDGDGNKNVTPIGNFGAKAGISYSTSDGFTASLFDVYQGHLDGYSTARNPRPGAYHLLNAHLRYDFSKYLPPNSKSGFAFVIHADNLVNRPIWFPDWKDTPGDSIFGNQGRTIYFGFEVSLRRE